jgi:hypothetical protein
MIVVLGVVAYLNALLPKVLLYHSDDIGIKCFLMLHYHSISVISILGSYSGRRLLTLLASFRHYL